MTQTLSRSVLMLCACCFRAGRLAAVAEHCPSDTITTVRHRGMGTGISEASKRVPIFSFATQGGKQVSSHFRQRTLKLGPSPRGSDPVSCRLT